MDGQESPSRHLRNVRAFRDLRIGSRTSWRSSHQGSQPTNNSRSEIYELLDNQSILSNQLTPVQSTPDLRPQLQDGQPFGAAAFAEPVIGRPEVPRSQRLGGSSQETITAQPCPRMAVWRELWLPLLCIHGSMLLVLTTLVVLVSVYRVEPDHGLFLDPTGWSDSRQRAYILLNIPASMNFLPNVRLRY
jgi:hypothetical protein